MSDNVPAYAMFASGIIARSAYHWQIWVEACGGTEQAVTAYPVLYDVIIQSYNEKEILKFFKTIGRLPASGGIVQKRKGIFQLMWRG